MGNKQLQFHTWAISKNQSNTGKIGIRIDCARHDNEEMTVTKEHLKDYGIDLSPNTNIDDYTHYHRTCVYCGKNWWGLHCPHDGYQNPCPECDYKPVPITNENDYCDCEFVINVVEAEALITAAIIEELQKLADLPNIQYQSPHVQAIYKSAILERIKELEKS